MTQRTVPFIAAGAMVAIAIVAQFLDVSPWVTVVGGISVMFLIVFLFMRRRKQIQFEAIMDPLLKARAEMVLSRMGIPDAVVIPVHGAGLPVVAMHDGHVLLSPRAGELLNDEELGAAALQAVSIRPDVLRSQMVRYYAPWAAVLLAAGAVSIYTGVPWIGLACLLMLAWLRRDVRRRTIAKQAMEANVESFLQRGGHAPALLSALVKMQSALIRSGVNQMPVMSQFGGMVETVARMGGIERAEVQRLMANLHASLEGPARSERAPTP